MWVRRVREWVSHVYVARAARAASTVQPPSSLSLAPERPSQPSLPLQSVSSPLITYTVYLRLALSLQSSRDSCTKTNNSWVSKFFKVSRPSAQLGKVIAFEMWFIPNDQNVLVPMLLSRFVYLVGLDIELWRPIGHSPEGLEKKEFLETGFLKTHLRSSGHYKLRFQLRCIVLILYRWMSIDNSF